MQSEIILGSAGGQQVNIGVGRRNLKPPGSENTESTEESESETTVGEIESTEGESVEDFKEQIVPNEQSRGGREIDRQDEENKGTDVSVEAKEEERIIEDEGGLDVEENVDYYDDVWEDYEDYVEEYDKVERHPKVDFARWVSS